VSISLTDIISVGTSFHAARPACEKARSPNLICKCGNTQSDYVSDRISSIKLLSCVIFVVENGSSSYHMKFSIQCIAFSSMPAPQTTACRSILHHLSIPTIYCISDLLAGL
jgi:hypothetical protein